MSSSSQISALKLLLAEKEAVVKSLENESAQLDNLVLSTVFNPVKTALLRQFLRLRKTKNAVEDDCARWKESRRNFETMKKNLIFTIKQEQEKITKYFF